MLLLGSDAPTDGKHRLACLIMKTYCKTSTATSSTSMKGKLPCMALRVACACSRQWIRGLARRTQAPCVPCEEGLHSHLLCTR